VRVLVVDDDPAICNIISLFLEEAELLPVCATTDREAYRLITSLPTIRGLVVDVNLGPGTTGFDVARFARRVIPGLPVVYISGQATPLAYGSFGVPESDFVEKPFTPKDLLSPLLRGLERRAAGEA
jgi:DNA-binding NtrC family response regulator